MVWSTRVTSRVGLRGRPPAGGLGTSLMPPLAVVDPACEALLSCAAVAALSPRALDEASSTLLDRDAANRSVMFSSSRATWAVCACNRCSIWESDSREERLPWLSDAFSRAATRLPIMVLESSRLALCRSRLCAACGSTMSRTRGRRSGIGGVRSRGGTGR